MYINMRATHCKYRISLCYVMRVLRTCRVWTNPHDGALLFETRKTVSDGSPTHTVQFSSCRASPINTSQHLFPEQIAFIGRVLGDREDLPAVRKQALVCAQATSPSIQRAFVYAETMTKSPMVSEDEPGATPVRAS